MHFKHWETVCCVKREMKGRKVSFFKDREGVNNKREGRSIEGPEAIAQRSGGEKEYTGCLEKL